jgi:hypothetical protein
MRWGYCNLWTVSWAARSRLHREACLLKIEDQDRIESPVRTRSPLRSLSVAILPDISSEEVLSVYAMTTHFKGVNISGCELSPVSAM